MKKKTDTRNLLDLIPVQNVNWTKNDENLIVLLKPKYTNRWFVKHILPRMKKPNYKISLDSYGSAVWKNCDGRNSVAVIGDLLIKEFGEKVEPVYERLALFIKTLEKSKFIYYLSQ